MNSSNKQQSRLCLGVREGDGCEKAPPAEH